MTATLEVKSVHEIKVGDEVRVVQIIVKWNDTKAHYSRRMEYLGETGEVTCISPRLLSAIHVKLRMCLVTHVFHPRELQVLSAPCEEQESSGAGSNLYRMNKFLIKENKQLREQLERNRATRERLERSRKELQEQYEGLIQASANTRVSIRNILNAAQRT